MLPLRCDIATALRVAAGYLTGKGRGLRTTRGSDRQWRAAEQAACQYLERSGTGHGELPSPYVLPCQSSEGPLGAHDPALLRHRHDPHVATDFLNELRNSMRELR